MAAGPPDVAGTSACAAVASVDVLLATYNGARHLAAQLDSILGQTHGAFRLLVSDDGSRDGTLAILEQYRPRFGGRMVLVPNPAPGGGAVRNFENLMQASLGDGVADCVAFCDQDDVWLPHKLQALAARMQLLQAQAGTLVPCAVHSDLRVVDERLRLIHPSFARQQHFDPAKCSPVSLLSVNQVTGCAMMVNRALLQLALPLPGAAVMHDWWCALLARAGCCAFIDEPLILYRQHGANQLGAKSRTVRSRVRRLVVDGPAVLRRVRALGRATRAQAQALQARLLERGLDADDVSAYLAWRARPWWQRWRCYRGYFVGPELDRVSRLLLW